MSTDRQIEANRRNSRLSTGPRTLEGKAVARFNALKSGINSKAPIIPGEDPAELQAIITGYHQDWAPTTYLQRFLVDSLVQDEWLLHRLSRLEAEMWSHHIEDARTSSFHKLNEDAPIGDVYSRTYERFTRLQRRIDSTKRSYYHALTQLQHLLREPEDAPAPPVGPAPEIPASGPSIPAPCPPAPEPCPPAPVPVPELASFCRVPVPRQKAPLYPWTKVPPTRPASFFTDFPVPAAAGLLPLESLAPKYGVRPTGSR